MTNKTKPEEVIKASEGWIIYMLVLIAVSGAIWTALDECAHSSDLPLKYLIVAGALLMSRKLKSISLGDTKAEFNELKDEAESIRDIVKAALTEAQLAEGAVKTGVPSRLMVSGGAENEIKPGSAVDDPWNGCFEGKSEANNRKLSAEVTPRTDREGWFILRLRVDSSDEKMYPLHSGQKVQFFLHNTFPNDRPVITAVNGVAELVLNVWGAFTVGVLTDDGKTKLELNLANDPKFPRLFRSR